MLKSNSKKAIENIRKYIMRYCTPENYIGYSIDKEPETWEEVSDFIRKTFEKEMCETNKNYKKNYVSKEDLFIDWCQGLPSAIDCCYYYNRSAVEDVVELLEEDESILENSNECIASEYLTKLIYRELYKNK